MLEVKKIQTFKTTSEWKITGKFRPVLFRTNIMPPLSGLKTCVFANAAQLRDLARPM